MGLTLHAHYTRQPLHSQTQLEVWPYCCYCRDPATRPTARDALSHPWLAKGRGKGAGLKQRGVGDQLGTVVQRLQRYSQQNAFKKTVLDMMANELLSRHLQLLKEEEEEMAEREEGMEEDEDGVQDMDVQETGAAAAGADGLQQQQQPPAATAAGGSVRGRSALTAALAEGGSLHGRRSFSGSRPPRTSKDGSMHGEGSVHSVTEGSVHRSMRSMRGAAAALSALEALRRARERRSAADLGQLAAGGAGGAAAAGGEAGSAAGGPGLVSGAVVVCCCCCWWWASRAGGSSLPCVLRVDCYINTKPLFWSACATQTSVFVFCQPPLTHLPACPTHPPSLQRPASPAVRIPVPASAAASAGSLSGYRGPVKDPGVASAWDFSFMANRLALEGSAHGNPHAAR